MKKPILDKVVALLAALLALAAALLGVPQLGVPPEVLVPVASAAMAAVAAWRARAEACKHTALAAAQAEIAQLKEEAAAAAITAVDAPVVR